VGATKIGDSWLELVGSGDLGEERDEPPGETAPRSRNDVGVAVRKLMPILCGSELSRSAVVEGRPLGLARCVP